MTHGNAIRQVHDINDGNVHIWTLVCSDVLSGIYTVYTQ